MIPPFKFELDDLEEVQTELTRLINILKEINKRSELYAQKIIDSGVSEEDIIKIFDILTEE